jgi:hypothetical protein
MNTELLEALKAEDKLTLFVESTLNSVALPSGNPSLSRAFADIRQALATQAALRRAIISKEQSRTHSP